MDDDTLTTLGVGGAAALAIIACLFVLIPAICAIIVGLRIATIFMLTGGDWWAFMILFVAICVSIIYKVPQKS